ncbi:hypothetical protein HME9304_01722 [Flagellimonas maritima]|uniref:3-keto-alpha-glucoside-1,2-lyase/3-keto-2-hydroxy-glucal hydratase domain-containing protein n=1 Tax=Flagellimonas maritima TaxID=1383885 RepID=A0A2Z4LSM2_9FLAO|nr:DUF1080 domain-containing protein [Allomuricauda aurantiaca]AWX44719.1 hypothetical protein HME9304_01722 [Allomuricauda aurantiaca]
MKKKILFLVVIAVMSCKDKPKETQNEMKEERETQIEDNNEWTVLFDGSSFDGWHFYRGGAVAEPWKLENGAMVFHPPENRPKGESYNIVTDKEYKNFVLRLEWKISEGGNSGIFWGVNESEEFGQPYETGPEIQVLDDEKHPDAKNGTTHQAGALYDMVAPSEKAVKSVGEWNMVELMVNHGENKGIVILNDKKIAEFPVNGPEWDKMVADSKFADWDGFGIYKTGKIGLQDHGDIVAFRNIKIKEL